MQRKYRVALEILAPAPLGLMVLLLPSMAGEVSRRGPSALWVGWGTLVGIGMVGLVAYLIAGIPSLIYAWVLETCYRRGLNPESWSAVALSTFLGLLAGTGMVVVMAWSAISFDQLLMFGGAGLLTGLIIGIAILFLTRAALKREAGLP